MPGAHGVCRRLLTAVIAGSSPRMTTFVGKDGHASLKAMKLM
jgi:hypothetical protein